MTENHLHSAAARKPIRRALLSVSDKTRLAPLACALHEAGVALVATSSTAKAIEESGVQVTEISALTGFPEILGGRVKTLHPAVHGGILAQQGDAQALKEIGDLGIEPFDLVVANLYPFAETLRSGAQNDQIVEMIDIGGPTLIRAAAKNYAHVAVVVDPADYTNLMSEVAKGGTTEKDRNALAAKAFQLVADYDVEIATWFEQERTSRPFPEWKGSTYRLERPLRYGENPHQGAAVYSQVSPASTGGLDLVGGQVLGGKELSFNNLRDAAAALAAVQGFEKPTVAIIKHANPSGLASAANLVQAYERALACDPLSAFGGIVAANGEVDQATASQITKVFTEVVIAPAFTPEALETLRKKKSLRILQVDGEPASASDYPLPGGSLLQEEDTQTEEDLFDRWALVAGKPATGRVKEDLQFAWNAVRHVKSNAILLARDSSTVGVGMGQVNRLDSARLAVQRANTLGEGNRSEGAVAASDAFFPFPDGLQILIDAGVTAVVAPGGSKGDPQVIDAAREAGITLYFTGVRHFWH